MAGFLADKKDKMSRYYLNFKSQYKTLSFTFFVWIVLSILVYFKFKNDNDLQGKYIAYSIAFLFSCSFSLILYFIYLYHSIGKTVIIDHHEQKIYVNTRSSSISFDMKEIVKVLKVCSYPLGENRTQWMPTDPFFYIKIIMKNGQSITITSLMTDSHFSMFGYKIEIEKRLIPWPW